MRGRHGVRLATRGLRKTRPRDVESLRCPRHPAGSDQNGEQRWRKANLPRRSGRHVCITKLPAASSPTEAFLLRGTRQQSPRIRTARCRRRRRRRCRPALRTCASLRCPPREAGVCKGEARYISHWHASKEGARARAVRLWLPALLTVSA